MPLPEDWYKDLTPGSHWDEVWDEDSIFQVSQRGAKALETKWARHTKKWLPQLKRSVGRGLFGLGRPEIAWRQLYRALYLKRWPSGLSREEERLLQLSRLTQRFNPAYTQGLETDNVLNPEVQTALPSSESLLKALKKYAAVVKKETYQPMVKDLEAQATVTGKLIQPFCLEVYALTGPELCTSEASENMFLNDLRRGSHTRNLRVSPAMYKTLPAFFSLYGGL